MLSADLRHLQAQVRFFLERDMLPSIGSVVFERLGSLADLAAALEAAVVPDGARELPSGDNVVMFPRETRRRRGGR